MKNKTQKNVTVLSVKVHGQRVNFTIDYIICIIAIYMGSEKKQLPSYNRINETYNSSWSAEIHPMKTKQRADDDLSHVPHVQSRIPELEDLVLFTGKGDRVITKFDKQVPQAYMAARYIDLSHSQRTLITESQEGYVGLSLARMNPHTQISMYDSNVSDRSLSAKNVDKNYIVGNVSTIEDDELDELLAQGVDSVVYSPKGFTAMDLIESNIHLAAQGLRLQGEFILISNKKMGADRHIQLLEKVMGTNSEIVARGDGGFRIVKATKLQESEPFNLDKYRKTISFKVLGQEFDLKTEPSLFSKDGLDVGTRFLLENTNLVQFNQLLDLGCGWGAIGIVGATINSSGESTMVDVNSRAVRVANDNANALGISDRAQAITTQDFKTIPGNFDQLMSNPPFHADRGDLVQMFTQAREKLSKKSQGSIVVENTYLDKLSSVLEEVFGRAQLDIQDPEIKFSILKVTK